MLGIYGCMSLESFGHQMRDQVFKNSGLTVGVGRRITKKLNAMGVTTALMEAIDSLNHSGTGKVWFAGQGIEKAWSMKREMLSPSYTTKYADLPVAR